MAMLTDCEERLDDRYRRAGVGGRDSVTGREADRNEKQYAPHHVAAPEGSVSTGIYGPGRMRI